MSKQQTSPRFEPPFLHPCFQEVFVVFLAKTCWRCFFWTYAKPDVRPVLWFRPLDLFKWLQVLFPLLQVSSRGPEMFCFRSDSANLRTLVDLGFWGLIKRPFMLGLYSCSSFFLGLLSKGKYILLFIDTICAVYLDFQCLAVLQLVWLIALRFTICSEVKSSQGRACH